MAITCPPPLPPGKRFLQRASRKFAIGPSYKSFRDPSLEAWIPPSQRICTPHDDDDIDDIDGFDLIGIKVTDQTTRLDIFFFFSFVHRKNGVDIFLICQAINIILC